MEIVKVKVKYGEAQKKPNEQVYYRNKSELFRKIEIMRRQGINQLQILSDFDHTISSSKINGKLNVPSIGVFRESAIFSDSFKRKLSQLFKFYFPIVFDPTISMKEKVVANHDWAQGASKIIYEQGITR